MPAVISVYQGSRRRLYTKQMDDLRRINKYFPFSSFDYISNAINEERYIEAILLIHMGIHVDLVELIIHAVYARSKPPRTLNTEEFYPIKEHEWLNCDFITAARICLFMDTISDLQFSEIKELNAFRNRMAHGVLKKPIAVNLLKEECLKSFKLLKKIDDLANA